MQERVPAQNIEAEQAELGAILIDNSVMNNVAEILKPSDFYRIVHQIKPEEKRCLIKINHP